MLSSKEHVVRCGNQVEDLLNNSNNHCFICQDYEFRSLLLARQVTLGYDDVMMCLFYITAINSAMRQKTPSKF